MRDRNEVSPLTFPRFAALVAILLALSAVPLLLTELLPLLDYPNHLARMHLLPSLPVAALERYYAVVWAPLPNLAMDGTVPFLAQIMPLAWAGKAFVLLSFVLLIGGVAACHRVLFGLWSLWPCLAFLLLYSRLLLWGFVGYLFGCGLALAVFAVWMAIGRRHWALRLLIGGFFALAIYLAHLLAFGVYAVMIAGYELGRVWRLGMKPGAALKALAIGAVPFLPALALMTMNSSTGRIIFASPLRKFDLLFSVFDNYSRPFDVACFVLAVLAVGFVFQRRWVKLAPGMAGPLIGLVILYVAMPTQLFTAAGADRRIPLMIFLLLIGCSRWVMPNPALERRFMAAAAVMFVARLAVVAATWQSSGKLYAELLPGLNSVPRGSCIAAAYDDDGLSVQKAPLAHFPTIAVARRDAFVTSLFAYPMQQPIRLQPDAQALANVLSASELWQVYVTGAKPLSATMKAALVQCDYIAFSGSKPFALENASGLTAAFVTPRFQLYRVARPASSAS